jgi:hypothetical protein
MSYLSGSRTNTWLAKGLNSFFLPFYYNFIQKIPKTSKFIQRNRLRNFLMEQTHNLFLMSHTIPLSHSSSHSVNHFTGIITTIGTEYITFALASQYQAPWVYSKSRLVTKAANVRFEILLFQCYSIIVSLTISLVD